ncbi:hypothetical protein [Flagellimonas sediminis]|uniref:Chemotaxis methyl-accepting receptor HlyB-like 4HB MCP domain-containing protein n=1 Tax=Flagellimonas sediminis TaxID=2696468 RepID=A0A6I5KWU0_9FLAO|nr:hypothetical protein [Allomuricauda sediminis]NDV45277.1 hypothetical protein [Allomuricauda sediminis]
MIAKLSVKQRIQVGLILSVAFGLVLGSNLMDRRHFSTIEQSVKSIYVDRIVVQDYIYQLQNHVHKMALDLIGEQQQFDTYHPQGRIDGLLGDFAQTQLTREEARLLGELRQQFSALDLKDREPALAQLQRIGQTLDGLEQIQLDQGNRLTELSEKTLGVNRMLSNLEVVFLVIIAICIMLLIFYPVKIFQPIHWN